MGTPRFPRNASEVPVIRSVSELQACIEQPVCFQHFVWYYRQVRMEEDTCEEVSSSNIYLTFSSYWLLCWVMALLMSVRDKKPGKGQIYCRTAAFLNSDEKPSIDSTWLSYTDLQTRCCLKHKVKWGFAPVKNLSGLQYYGSLDLQHVWSLSLYAI